ncbi:MAG: PepSY domain-containing protein [Gammaproteobacteria bacterium]
MKSLLPVAVVIALGSSGAALAGDDCRRPMAEWQSRDAVTAHVAALGITPERLRIDDGCYEIRGRDGDGNRVGLTVDPATLSVLALEVRFAEGADPSRYLPDARGRAGKPATTR